MNPIKAFFQKKKVEKTFKQAGPGHKLTDSRPSNTNQGQSGSRSGPSAPPQYSEGARRAAEAAFARVGQNQGNVNWSSQAIKAQAKKEIEQENASKVKQQKSPTIDPVIQDACPSLAVSGVYFKCPMISPEVLPKEEIKDRIRSFLYEQLEQEPGLTACLIIHTLNEDQEKVSLGVKILIKCLTNILEHPEDKKYRKIRFENPTFKKNVLELEGAFDFLRAAGFLIQVQDHEECFVFPDDCTEDDFANAQMLTEALVSAEPIRPILDRNLRVLMPAQASAEASLPQEFFRLSLEELKREQEARAETVDQLTTLRTKAMRERDQVRELHMYRYTLIKIRFPDDVILQGTFYVKEKLVAVKEFVQDNLIEPGREFHLLAPGGSKLSEDGSSLLELKLVPAVIINFLWASGPEDRSNDYLVPEVMALLSES